MVISHPLSASSIYYYPWHALCSIYMPDSLFPQSPSFLSTSCLAPSASYSIHFFTQSLSFFAAYAHTITVCFAVVPRLCPSLSFNPLFGTLSCSLTPHIHLTSFIFACWSATSFFLSYRPGLTSMWHATSHMTAVQSPSRYQWQAVVPSAWIYSMQFEF